MSKVNVYREGKVIGRVEFCNNLDFWDGHNWSCGEVGRHKGIARFGKNQEKYAMVEGTNWQGERDYAYEISPEDAMQEILKSGDDKLFDEFPELKVLAEKNNLL